MNVTDVSEAETIVEDKPPTDTSGSSALSLSFVPDKATLVDADVTEVGL